MSDANVEYTGVGPSSNAAIYSMIGSNTINSGNLGGIMHPQGANPTSISSYPTQQMMSVGASGMGMGMGMGMNMAGSQNMRNQLVPSISETQAYMGSSASANYRQSGELFSILQETSRSQGVNGSTNPSQSLDMANFPALESRMSGMSVNGSGDLNGAGMTAERLQNEQEFVMQKEDFPALPGFGSGNTLNSGKGDASSRQSGSLASQNSADEDAAHKYGILGLLGVIKMTNKDLSMLSLGIDLTALGLNLNSQESLYSTFSSLWAANPCTREPKFKLPMCYYMQPPALKTDHLSKFQLETLFYVFYAMPKDVLQAYAARELSSREWHYHADLKLWFKLAALGDDVNSAAMGLHGNPQYIYFDINAWERRPFSGNIQGGVSAGFMKEEDLRVKFNPAAS